MCPCENVEGAHHFWGGNFCVSKTYSLISNHSYMVYYVFIIIDVHFGVISLCKMINMIKKYEKKSHFQTGAWRIYLVEDLINQKNFRHLMSIKFFCIFNSSYKTVSFLIKRTIICEIYNKHDTSYLFVICTIIVMNVYVYGSR